MAAIPDWYDGAFDVCRLGGHDIPGVVEVDVQLRADIDRQKGAGRQKGRSRDRGDKAPKVKITITMTPDEREAFAELVPQLNPAPRTGVRDPLAIEHPNTALWGIRAIEVHEIDSPQPRDGGFWIVTVNAEEWSASQPEVKPGAQKPADDATPWLPFVDDDLAGTGAPAEAGAEEGLGL